MQNEEFIAICYIMIYHPAKFQVKIFISFCVKFDKSFEVVLSDSQIFCQSLRKN